MLGVKKMPRPTAVSCRLHVTHASPRRRRANLPLLPPHRWALPVLVPAGSCMCRVRPPLPLLNGLKLALARMALPFDMQRAAGICRLLLPSAACSEVGSIVCTVPP